MPDAVEPIRAFRAWTVGVHGTWQWFGLWIPNKPVPEGVLVSVYTDTHWPAGEALRAICYERYRFTNHDRPGCSEVPGEDCPCGIYASTDLDHIIRSYGSWINTVIGVVAMWGRVQEHKLGYRASIARPVALGMPDKGLANLVLTKRAADAYGVPLVPMEELHSLVA